MKDVRELPSVAQRFSPQIWEKPAEFLLENGAFVEEIGVKISAQDSVNRVGIFLSVRATHDE
jgi:hypothetical protein